MKEDGQILNAILFENDAVNISGQMDVTEHTTNVDLMSSIVYKLPCQVTGNITNGKVINVQKNVDTSKNSVDQTTLSGLLFCFSNLIQTL